MASAFAASVENMWGRFCPLCRPSLKGVIRRDQLQFRLHCWVVGPMHGQHFVHASKRAFAVLGVFQLKAQLGRCAADLIAERERHSAPGHVVNVATVGAHDVSAVGAIARDSDSVGCFHCRFWPAALKPWLCCGPKKWLTQRARTAWRPSLGDRQAAFLAPAPVDLEEAGQAPRLKASGITFVLGFAAKNR
jgi:hypothetical protein